MADPPTKDPPKISITPDLNAISANPFAKTPFCGVMLIVLTIVLDPPTKEPPAAIIVVVFIGELVPPLTTPPVVIKLPVTYIAVAVPPKVAPPDPYMVSPTLNVEPDPFAEIPVA